MKNEDRVIICLLGTRSIRRKTIRRGQFVADYSSHGQFVAKQNSLRGQFVANVFLLITLGHMC